MGAYRGRAFIKKKARKEIWYCPLHERHQQMNETQWKENDSSTLNEADTINETICDKCESGEP